jgi:hypothetical protein
MIDLAFAALTLAAAAGAATLPPLDERQRAAVTEALQDEREGEALYADVIKAHGSVRPFSNVIEAERRHAAFLAETLDKRGVSVPAGKVGPKPPSFTSIAQACETALAFEKRNVALYDRILAAGPFPADVKQALEHNRMASQEHHIPAFERCTGVAEGAGCVKGGQCCKKGGAVAGRAKATTADAPAGCKKQGRHCCKREGCKKAEAAGEAKADCAKATTADAPAGCKKQGRYCCKRGGCRKAEAAGEAKAGCAKATTADAPAGCKKQGQHCCKREGCKKAEATGEAPADCPKALAPAAPAQ